ncbi:nucleoporin NDC1-like [Dendronephthya gigantea]|uniref:nucleoporin NDC1-like n=1 Tax=Dendronephthya gigantea TaxID=151771 RepID=UPI001069CC81|nr:nucleoporin NDC1-like [Dendronephthya gigantea]
MDFFAKEEDDVLMCSSTNFRRIEVKKLRSTADEIILFSHKEFLWRNGISFLWFICLLPAICILYLTLVLFSLQHPLTWITDVLLRIFSFWDIFVFVVIFGIAVTPVILLNIKICSVEIKTGITRLSVIKSFFTVKHLSHLIFSTITASFAIHWLTSMTYHEYGVFTRNCSISYDRRISLCLNETTLFIHCFGGVLGVVYSILYFKDKHHHIIFPVVQQERIFRVKACMVPCLWQAIPPFFQGTSKKSIQIGFVLFFCFGSCANEIVQLLTGLDHDSQINRLDSFYRLFDLRFLWFCFLSGIVIPYIWLLTNKLFGIIHTEVLRFPLQSTFTDVSDQTLPVALKCQTVPLLKYHAFNDLCQLSQFSQKRRKQIFALSVPGGRPLNWLWISDDCLTCLNNLKERLVSYDNHNHVAYRQSGTNESLGENKNQYFRARNQSSVKKTPNSVKSQTTLGLTNSGNKSLRHTLAGHQLSSSLPSENTRFEIKSKVLLSNELKQIPVIEYFLEKVDELEMERLFTDVQLQIWAAEALSRLVVACLRMMFWCRSKVIAIYTDIVTGTISGSSMKGLQTTSH